jgi:hypothetical protein
MRPKSLETRRLDRPPLVESIKDVVKSILSTIMERINRDSWDAGSRAS